MYFRVNGVAMFLKGANLIPFDTLRTRVTQKYMVATLQGALDGARALDLQACGGPCREAFAPTPPFWGARAPRRALKRHAHTNTRTHPPPPAVNMNVLRVWGGGIYLPNAFYDLADEMGILLWQEAMFACAMYPADPAFLSNVRQEMKEQVLRLGSHASLGVWGGNNENEVGFWWFAESRANRTFYQDEYVKLYFDTVGDEITKVRCVCVCVFVCVYVSVCLCVCVCAFAGGEDGCRPVLSSGAAARRPFEPPPLLEARTNARTEKHTRTRTHPPTHTHTHTHTRTHTLPAARPRAPLRRLVPRQRALLHRRRRRWHHVQVRRRSPQGQALGRRRQRQVWRR